MTTISNRWLLRRKNSSGVSTTWKYHEAELLMADVQVMSTRDLTSGGAEGMVDRRSESSLKNSVQ